LLNWLPIIVATAVPRKAISVEEIMPVIELKLLSKMPHPSR
jgi:hypothetical protein